MPIDFYHVPGSAPCRAVGLAAAALGIELNRKLVDLMNGAQHKPEFLKINPQHTVPAIDDNGFYLWESRPIMLYLAEQYAPDSKLYPKDPKARAVINQRLFFDVANLYNAFMDYYHTQFFLNQSPDPQKLAKLKTAVGFVETFLKDRSYVAGDNLTLADLSLVTTVSNLDVVGFDLKEYQNVSRWYAQIKKEAPQYDEIDGAGAKAFKAFVDMLAKSHL